MPTFMLMPAVNTGSSWILAPTHQSSHWALGPNSSALWITAPVHGQAKLAHLGRPLMGEVCPLRHLGLHCARSTGGRERTWLSLVLSTHTPISCFCWQLWLCVCFVLCIALLFSPILTDLAGLPARGQVLLKHI